MKKSTLASAIILMAIATTAVAQPLGGYGPGPGPGGRGMMSGAPCMGGGGRGPGGGGGPAGIDFRVQRMTQMLGLSPQQQDQVRDILEGQQNSRQAMRYATRRKWMRS
jgi:Spy/CpxP family protein refolding chaperone